MDSIHVIVIILIITIIYLLFNLSKKVNAIRQYKIECQKCECPVNKNIFDPLIPPEKNYITSKNRNPYFNTAEYQLMGFIYNSSTKGKYPLYGRTKYDRSDRYEYYIIDESRNKLKIPIPTKNYIELYTGDTVTSEYLDGEYKVFIYENKPIRIY